MTDRGVRGKNHQKLKGLVPTDSPGVTPGVTMAAGAFSQIAPVMETAPARPAGGKQG